LAPVAQRAAGAMATAAAAAADAAAVTRVAT